MSDWAFHSPVLGEPKQPFFPGETFGGTRRLGAGPFESRGLGRRRVRRVGVESYCVPKTGGQFPVMPFTGISSS
jgi:hypothetical protein